MIDIKHIQRYVFGACAEYFQHSAPSDPAAFIARATDKVFRYLQGTLQLDATCSAFECALAHEVAEVFGWPERQRARRMCNLPCD